MYHFISAYKRRKFYSKLIGKGDLCFDIGANIGSKSKLFLSLGAKVIAFEPQSNCSEKLLQLKKKNAKFDFYPFAVGSQNEEKELFLANHSEVATFSKDFVAFFTTETIFWNATEMVPVKTLDTLIKDFGLPDYCKIDTESYEYEILSKLTHTIPIIEFEFTGRYMEDTLKIIDLLTSDDTEFNFILNETQNFKLKKWVNSAVIKTILGGLPKHQLHGNLFVKSINKKI
jgi:FkbM family methyltransferase